MYLKTRDEQESIRNAHPKAVHCDLLLHNNNACLGCKNNPNEGKNETAAETVEQNAVALNWLLGMAKGVQRGFIRTGDLDAKSGDLVQIALDHLDNQHDRKIARLIGREVAEIIVKVFNARQ